MNIPDTHPCLVFDANDGTLNVFMDRLLVYLGLERTPENEMWAEQMLNDWASSQNIPSSTVWEQIPPSVN